VEKKEKWTKRKLSKISNFQKCKGATPNLKIRKRSKNKEKKLLP
jgi:hypothetical protein